MAGLGLVQACNEHPVEFANTDGITDFYPEPPSPESEMVDILWVIDNSASMCQEQEALRTEFPSFIEKFAERNIDFNIGVTTTQMQIETSEPVALPGQLQSTPQPVPSYYAGCLGNPGDAADQTDGYEPIRKNLEAAIECTKDPSKWQHLLDVEDDAIECIIANTCDEELEDLFPSAQNGESPYREIPRVLRAQDYRQSDGLVDREALKDDFACMSMVGTKGYAFEKGLSAVAKAVTPEMTGGTVENPTDSTAPNHGLLREDAQFSAIFLTDENDCSNDGSLNECVFGVCELANHPNFEGESPLIPTSQLASESIENLSSSKGFDVSLRDVVVASIHGNSNRYGGKPGYPATEPTTFDICQPLSDDLAVKPSCQDERFGTAYSGDRYESFLRNFDADRIYPRAQGDYMPGLVCDPDDFDGHMAGIASTIVDATEQCITTLPRPCEGPSDATCPDYAFGQGASACQAFGQSSQYFCDSAVQVRLYPGDRSFEELQNHAYCVPESVDSLMTPGGCVVDRKYYGLTSCSASDNGVRIEWDEVEADRWFEELRGYELEVVVATPGMTRP